MTSSSDQALKFDQRLRATSFYLEALKKSSSPGEWLSKLCFPNIDSAKGESFVSATAMSATWIFACYNIAQVGAAPCFMFAILALSMPSD